MVRRVVSGEANVRPNLTRQLIVSAGALPLVVRLIRHRHGLMSLWAVMEAEVIGLRLCLLLRRYLRRVPLVHSQMVPRLRKEASRVMKWLILKRRMTRAKTCLTTRWLRTSFNVDMLT